MIRKTVVTRVGIQCVECKEMELESGIGEGSKQSAVDLCANVKGS
jgi:hypothetical protein